MLSFVIINITWGLVLSEKHLIVKLAIKHMHVLFYILRKVELRRKFNCEFAWHECGYPLKTYEGDNILNNRYMVAQNEKRK